MTRPAFWLAALYVVLLPLGRSGLPLNAQWGDLVFPLLAIAVWRGGAAGPWVSPRDWPLGVYLIVTAMAAMASPEPLTGLGHLAKQLYVAGVFLVFRVISRDSQARAQLQRVLVGIVALVAFASICSVFLFESGAAPLSPLGWAGGALPFFGLVLRLRGAFEAPEFLGNLMLVAFVLCMGFRALAPARQRSVWTAILALLAGAEFLTFSHSVAGFVIAGVFFAWSSLSTRPLRIALGVGAFGVVLIVNAASVLNPVRKDRPAGSEAKLVSWSMAGREFEAQLDHYVLLKRVSWSAFTSHPWTGIGPGRFIAETRRAQAEGLITRSQVGLIPHSAPLGRLAETGIFGGLSLLWLWASWLRPGFAELAAMDPVRRAAFAAVCGLLVNSVNADIMNFRFLWLALAWAAATPLTRSGPSFTRP